MSPLENGKTEVRLAMVKYDLITVEMSKGESKSIDILKKGKKKGVLQLSLE